jgi:hydroxymethylbilane synthase
MPIIGVISVAIRIKFANESRFYSCQPRWGQLFTFLGPEAVCFSHSHIMMTLRIATRKSPLALWQAEHVANRLQQLGVSTELVPLVSGGDTDMSPIDGSRQVGVFTKRIQQALIADEADIAVHSLKDLPTEVDDRLALAAVPERETVEDALVSAESWTVTQLPPEARVGTGSRRRAAQLLSIRPDLRILPIRGNVQTRLGKLDAGEFEAIMLAEAGVVRLQKQDLPRKRLPLAEMLPAPGQGALGIEVRSDDVETLETVARLDDVVSRAAVTAERRLLASLHGGCLAPIAALADVSDGRLRMTAAVLSMDGKRRIDEQHDVVFERATWEQSACDLATSISRKMVDRGAIELIQAHR